MDPTTPNTRIRKIFQSKAAKTGGVVRRRVYIPYASEDDLKEEVIRRGFHMVVSGDQYVILCNTGEFRVIC
jgi:hypothetical protein